MGGAILVVMLIELVRRRPGMYVGNAEDGVLNMILEVVANAIDQHLAGRCTRIDVALDGDGTVTVEDDGPGIAAAIVETVLTRHSDRATVDGHAPHVHIGLGGAGLYAVNALSERFEITTVRDGVETTAAFARGESVTEIRTVATSRPPGTRVCFLPDVAMFPHPGVQRERLVVELAQLAFLLPGLALTWHVRGNDLASHGLAGMVAQAAWCPTSRVAHYACARGTPDWPIDAAVALTWQPRTTGEALDPHIDSFVNLHRTRDHGEHVAGLLEAVKELFPQPPPSSRLVAAVAVLLADVKFGGPTRDRLVTPAARVAVAETTIAALVDFAANR